jgi:hypothetical protein
MEEAADLRFTEERLPPALVTLSVMFAVWEDYPFDKVVPSGTIYRESSTCGTGRQFGIGFSFVFFVGE